MKIEKNNKIFESPAYRKDENRFYNIKVNFPSEELILYSDEKSYVIARGSDKYPTWIWTADDINTEQMAEAAKTLTTEFLTLEKNKVTGHCRIIDAAKKRHAWGLEVRMRDAFEKVKRQLR